MALHWISESTEKKWNGIEFFLDRFFKNSPRCPLTRWPKMFLEVSDCSGKLLLSRHAVCPPIRYYSEASFTTNQGLHSKFPHPTPRTAYQCTNAKEMSWIGPKMTELEPFSWTRSKFVKIREFLEIAIFDILAEILIPW